MGIIYLCEIFRDDIHLQHSLSRGFILFFLPATVFAWNGHGYLGGAIGASWAQPGNNNPQIHYYDGGLTDAYPIHGNPKTRAVIGLNGGFEFAGAGVMPAIALGFGAYTNLGSYDLSGQLIETATGGPVSTLYNTTIRINSTRLMAEAQFTWAFCPFFPYIDVGIGSAWNRSSGYSETAVNSTGYPPLPPFNSNTSTNFAYQLGLGVAYAFNFVPSTADGQYDRVSLAYHYVNSGTASFGTRGSVYPYRLSMGNLTANELYLTYTHYF